ncbi:MAG: energy-coupling factor ABC transporter ATP-binding protein [Bacteroidetes bacterium]|nr:energy-coupling factor ABC transporter ATP-binding protein [Bacteroidota bacterium]
MILLSFKNFSLSYSKALPPALKNINLDINERESVVVSGMSGAGKSTLCIAAANFLEAFPAVVTSGEILHSNGREKSRVAIVMQNFYAQITYLRSTVFEEIAFPCENLGLSRAEIIRRAEDAISKIRIGHLAYRDPLELSGGEKQKVVLASAIAMEPDLLILDEPLSQLDPESTSYLSDVLSELKSEMALLIAENDPYLTLKVADRVIVLSDGEIISDGKFGEILNSTTAQHLDLPAWTKCISEGVRRKAFRSNVGVNPYELNYKKAISTLKNLK